MHNQVVAQMFISSANIELARHLPNLRQYSIGRHGAFAASLRAGAYPEVIQAAGEAAPDLLRPEHARRRLLRQTIDTVNRTNTNLPHELILHALSPGLPSILLYSLDLDKLCCGSPVCLRCGHRQQRPGCLQGLVGTVHEKTSTSLMSSR